jgi:hypothetical protein
LPQLAHGWLHCSSLVLLAWEVLLALVLLLVLVLLTLVLLALMLLALVLLVKKRGIRNLSSWGV